MVSHIRLRFNDILRYDNAAHYLVLAECIVFRIVITDGELAEKAIIIQKFTLGAYGKEHLTPFYS